MAIATEKPSLNIVRRFKAPPEKVWRALTQPEGLKQWMGPSDDFKCPIAETEIKVGGRYHIGMLAPDSQMHNVMRRVPRNRGEPKTDLHVAVENHPGPRIAGYDSVARSGWRHRDYANARTILRRRSA